MATTKAAERIKTTREKHSLKCLLTDEELLQHGEDLATAIDNHSQVISEKESVIKQFKAKEAMFDAVIATEQLLVRNKCEHRMVDCNLVLNYTTQTATLTRLDTNEVVKERPLWEDEKQMDLGFDGKEEPE